jgi:hypothetical protein
MRPILWAAAECRDGVLRRAAALEGIQGGPWGLNLNRRLIPSGYDTPVPPGLLSGGYFSQRKGR